MHKQPTGSETLLVYDGGSTPVKLPKAGANSRVDERDTIKEMVCSKDYRESFSAWWN
jgi:hypothetical protein